MSDGVFWLACMFFFMFGCAIGVHGTATGKFSVQGYTVVKERKE